MHRINEKGRISSTIAVVVAIIAAFLFMSFRAVAPGTVKVVTQFGKVTGRVLHPGANFIIPVVENATTYNTKKVIYETTSGEKQKGSEADYKDYPVDTNTSDGQQVDIFYTVRFSVDPGKADWVLQNIGPETAVVERIVKTESRVRVRNVPRQFAAQELYTGDGVQKVQDNLFDELQPVFAENGLVLDSFGVREIKFTEEYINAIEAKQIAAVAVDTAQKKAEQAVYDKERKITEGEGQAQAQALQQQTLSPLLVQKMWIDKWNGTLPGTVAGDQPLILGLGQ